MSTCNCHSHATGDGLTSERIVPHPTEDRTVCLDACIAPLVLHLWDYDIPTLGSCCGHGKNAPSIVLSSAIDAPRALRLLHRYDPEYRVEVLAWVLASFGVSRETEGGSDHGE